jgi:hypothetical protein
MGHARGMQASCAPERLPCLATFAPAAAEMTVAPVEMLTDPMPSPPVPTMSSTAGRQGRGAGTQAGRQMQECRLGQPGGGGPAAQPLLAAAVAAGLQRWVRVCVCLG